MMKKYILTAAIILMGIGSANAQQRKGGGRPQLTVEQQVSVLKTQLSLTDEQTAKVTALYTEFDNNLKSGEVSKDGMREARETLNKQVEALLTDEQKETFKTVQANSRKGKGGREKND